MKRGDGSEQERGEKKRQGERQSKGMELKRRRPCFSKAFMFLTPTGCSSRLPGRGDRVCDMPLDTAQVNKISIWPLG